MFVNMVSAPLFGRSLNIRYSSPNYTPASTKLKGGLLVSRRPSVCPSVRLSVRGHNRVCSVSSTILVRSISYLHILSSNFRRCVAYQVYFKIWIFGNFFKFVTLTLSCVHVMWRLKLIPHLSFYCSHFWFCMMIPLDGLLNISPGFCQNCKFLFLANFFTCVFSLSVCGSIWYKVDCSHFQWYETWHADLSWPTSELSRFWSQCVDFTHFGTILT